MDPMERVNVSQDTTFVFQEEAQARGHQNYHCLITEIEVVGGTPSARCRGVKVDRKGTPHFSYEPDSMQTLESFDCVMMRKDPPFDMRYVFATYVLELASEKTFVMNNPKSLRDANEKMFSLHFPDLIPDAIVTAMHSEIIAFLQEHGGEGVAKPLDGAGGEGIFCLNINDQNHNAIIETVTNHGAQFAMVQAYLPEIRESGDHRLILLNGEVLGGVARIPPSGDLRGNIHVGGRCEKMELTPRELEICETLAPRLRADGLYFVGIDVIGDSLTEVNVTSPTGIQEINELNGVRLEANVLDFVEERCGA
jgi:glutathione synthase